MPFGNVSRVAVVITSVIKNMDNMSIAKEMYLAMRLLQREYIWLHITPTRG
jgi:hypothetical protein